jgi:phage host-nuclease inhibitor protein Gam
MPKGTSAKVAKAAAPVPRSGDVSGPGRPVRVPFAKAAADPRFRKLMSDVQRNAKKARKHPSAAQRAAEAQAASRPPGNERAAAAAADQVDAMDESRPRQAETGGFLAMLRAEIEKVMPKNLDESTRFMEGGAANQVRNAVSGEVRGAQENAAGPVEQAATAAPNEGAVPQRAPNPVPADPAAAPDAMATRNAVPTPRTRQEVSQRRFDDSADRAVRDTEFTDQQIGRMNAPQAQAVTAARGEVRQNVASSEQRYRAREAPALNQNAALATADGRAGATQLVAQSRTGRTGVMSRQEAARARDEARRRAVVDRIQSIYTRTKSTVEKKLETLETDVLAQFDRGSGAALAEMKRWSETEIKKFKDKRYEGAAGAARWVVDQFRAVPQEIKDILTQARTRFATQMDELAVQISNAVDARLADAKAEIKKGQADIAAYVATLDPDLRSVGRQAQADVQSQFQDLEQQVDAKKQDLANKLAQRYKSAFDQADAALKEIEKQNEGSMKKLADKVGEFVKMIAEMKAKLMAALRKGWGLVKRILADPIGFLGNLLNAVKGGVMKFVRNFGQHLMRGLIGWLFGALAGAGVTLPNDLSLPSILKLAMDILGLTWPRIRARAVRLVGEPVVRGIEMLAEFISIFVRGGPAALWAHLREHLSNLKGMVIDAIISWVTQTIITQAATRLLSSLNPAGAFVQACIAIYNTVMFFIERAQQIMAFVESILNSVENIANGNTGAAVNYIEQTLGRIVPLVISFLARLIGLGGITERIVAIIRRVQGAVERAIDAVLTRVIAAMRSLIRRVGGMVRGRDARTPEEKQRDLRAAVRAIEPQVQNAYRSRIGRAVLRARLALLKTRYRLTELTIVDKDGGRRAIRAVVNPIEEFAGVYVIPAGMDWGAVISAVAARIRADHEQTRAASGAGPRQAPQTLQPLNVTAGSGNIEAMEHFRARQLAISEGRTRGASTTHTMDGDIQVRERQGTHFTQRDVQVEITGFPRGRWPEIAQNLDSVPNGAAVLRQYMSTGTFPDSTLPEHRPLIAQARLVMLREGGRAQEAMVQSMMMTDVVASGRRDVGRNDQERTRAMQAVPLRGSDLERRQGTHETVTATFGNVLPLYPPPGGGAVEANRVVEASHGSGSMSPNRFAPRTEAEDPNRSTRTFEAAERRENQQAALMHQWLINHAREAATRGDAPLVFRTVAEVEDFVYVKTCEFFGVRPRPRGR